MDTHKESFTETAHITGTLSSVELHTRVDHLQLSEKAMRIAMHTLCQNNMLIFKLKVGNDAIVRFVCVGG